MKTLGEYVTSRPLPSERRARGGSSRSAASSSTSASASSLPRAPFTTTLRRGAVLSGSPQGRRERPYRPDTGATEAAAAGRSARFHGSRLRCESSSEARGEHTQRVKAHV